MADEAKLIDIVIKYTTQGAKEAADAFAKITGASGSAMTTPKVDVSAVTAEGEKAGKAFTEAFNKEAQKQAKNYTQASFLGSYDKYAADMERIKKIPIQGIGGSSAAQEINQETKAVEEFGKQAAETYPNAAQEIEQLSQGYVDLKKQMNDAGISGKQQKEIINQITAGQKDYSQAAAEVTAQTEKQAVSFQQLSRAARLTGDALNIAAGALLATGTAMSAPILKAANDYVKSAEYATQSTMDWNRAQDKLNDGYKKFGAVALDAALPILQKSAELMGMVADFAQQNPGAIKGILDAGLVLVGLAAVTKAVAEGIRLIGDIEYISAIAAEIGGMQNLAAALWANTAALNKSSVVGGSKDIAGSLGGNILKGGLITTGLLASAATVLKFSQVISDAGENLWKSLIPSLEKMGIFGQNAAKAIDYLTSKEDDLKRFLGILSAPQSSGGSYTSEASMKEGAKAYAEYLKNINDATEQYSSQRADIIAQYEQDMADKTAEYENERAQIIADFGQRMADAYANFARQAQNAHENYLDRINQINEDFALQQEKRTQEYNDRVEKAREDFQISERRAAKQHALDMQRLEEDHNGRIRDLAAARDALGIVKENEAYQKERARKDEDYEAAAAERKADFRRQLEELKENFAKQQAEAEAAHQNQLQDAADNYYRQRAQAVEAYQQEQERMKRDEEEKLKRLDEAHKVEMEKLDKNTQEKLDKLAEAYNREIEVLQANLIDQINAIDETILGMTDTLRAEAEQQLADFKDWIAAQKGGIGASATGGTIDIGSGATQAQNFSNAGFISDALAARNSARSGSRSLSVNVASRSLSISEIRNEIGNALDQRLSDLLPAFGV